MLLSDSAPAIEMVQHMRSISRLIKGPEPSPVSEVRETTNNDLQRSKGEKDFSPYLYNLSGSGAFVKPKGKDKQLSDKKCPARSEGPKRPQAVGPKGKLCQVFSGMVFDENGSQ